MPQTEVTVTIENLAPENGTFITPVWVGFHDGTFDTYDRGRTASVGLERLAEDGDTSFISEEFNLSGSGSLDSTILGIEGIEGPLDPGETASATFTLDSDDPNSRYFNYASMVIPSNDAFIANGDPKAIPVFDREGNFIGADFIIYGDEVLDAGTEVNDEAQDSTAFFGQAEPDTGTDENGVVESHPGFIEDGPILSEDGSNENAPAAFTDADFTEPGYQVARISVRNTDEPLPPPPDLVEVTVTIESLSPENGTLLTPLWVGFHDGNFDTYDRGRTASAGLESIAEDGDATILSEEFLASGAGFVDGIIVGAGGATEGPIDLGETTNFTFTLDRSLASSRFFNYASMVLPSNDAFIANGDPGAIEIFDEEGNFLGADFVVSGSQVLDAGTEVNDEAENSTAFFGQAEPNTGTDENGVVKSHPGFEPGGRILSEPDFANADFTAEGYDVARITITTDDVPTVVPEVPEIDSGLVDLTEFSEQSVEASFAEVTSNASFDNTVGFYAIEDASGTVIDEFGNSLTPSDEGYTAAAIANSVIELDQNTTGSQQLPGGDLLAPYIIANGTTEDILDGDSGEETEPRAIAYFSFLDANLDGVEHIRFTGENTFTFEDQLGGGDLDFDDFRLQVEFDVV